MAGVVLTHAHAHAHVHAHAPLVLRPYDLGGRLQEARLLVAAG